MALESKRHLPLLVQSEKFQGKALIGLACIIYPHLGLTTMPRAINNMTLALWVKPSFLGPGTQGLLPEEERKGKTGQEQNQLFFQCN